MKWGRQRHFKQHRHRRYINTNIKSIKIKEDNMSIKDIQEYFELDVSLIPLQEQVREDIYKILKRECLEPQDADCIAISTENDVHKIHSYPFNKEECFGCYKYRITNIEIKTDYKFKELEKLVKDKLKEVI